MVLNNLLNPTNVNDLYISLTEIGMLGKCSHFLGRHRQFQAFVKDLFTNPLFALKSTHEREMYEKHLQHYRVVINTYMSSCLLVIIIAGLSSIVSDPISLSYPAWFPFDYSSSRNLAYYLVFVYQNCGMGMHCLMNLTWDCLMPFLLVNLRCQFEVLGGRLRRGFTTPRDPNRTRRELEQWINHFNHLVRWVFTLIVLFNS